jgi:hypothetical protein
MSTGSGGSSPTVSAQEGLGFLGALRGTTRVCAAAVGTERPSQRSVQGIVQATGSRESAATMIYALSSSDHMLSGLDATMALQETVKPVAGNTPTARPMQVASATGSGAGMRERADRLGAEMDPSPTRTR